MRFSEFAVMGGSLLVLAGTSPATSRAAQTPPASVSAAETITGAALRRHVDMLSTDSLRGRSTPSLALERAAQYVAAEFQAIGLRPLADNRMLRRYPIPGRAVALNWQSSQVDFLLPAKGAADAAPQRETLIVPFATGARFLLPHVPETVTELGRAPSAVLLAGPLTPAFLQQANLTNKAVLYIPPDDLDADMLHKLLEQLYEASRGVVVVIDQDSIRWASEQLAAQQRPLQFVDAFVQDEPPEDPHRWAIAVRRAAFQALLDTVGVNMTSLKAATVPIARELPELRVRLRQVLDSSTMIADTAAATVPNVVGMLEGTDAPTYPSSAKQCVVVQAPLDQLLSTSERVDGSTPSSLADRVEARTASIAGLLAVARAFKSLPGGPKRSVIFLASSGSAPTQTFWGSHYNLSMLWGQEICRPVMNITLDLSVGMPAAIDTVVIAGLDDVELVSPAAWAVDLHPELRLTLGNGGTVVQPRSDAFVFTQRGFPSLLIQGGASGDESVPPVSAAIDLDSTVRVLRLMFYLSHEIVEAARIPRWTSMGRRRAMGSR